MNQKMTAKEALRQLYDFYKIEEAYNKQAIEQLDGCINYIKEDITKIAKPTYLKIAVDADPEVMNKYLDLLNNDRKLCQSKLDILNYLKTKFEVGNNTTKR